VSDTVWSTAFLVMCIIAIGVCLIYIFSREGHH
jgi:hypothetical protein